jgi:hypothetical protein
VDKRAASTVVSKGLEITIVLLYVGVLSTALYGGVVPEARETADDAVAERALAAAVEDIRAAVPASGDGTVRLVVDLPATIGGQTYTVVPEGRTLVLHHPHQAVDSSVALLLPDRVDAITGRWESGDETVVEIEASDDGIDLRLVSE